MADRIISWSLKSYPGGTVMMLPSHFIEADYEVKAVRIHTREAPDGGDAKFEIYDDGVSIMNDNIYDYRTYIASTATYSGDTTIYLPEGEISDEMAEDFNSTPIEAGSWLTCYVTQAWGAKDITVQLELERISEGDEDTD